MMVPRLPTRIKILFLSANPLDTQRLQLDEEARGISARIRASDYRDSLDLDTQWAVRTDDMLQLLNQYKPHIVHFSGHGCAGGELLLMDARGKSKRVKRRALAELFAAIRDNIRLVVFNACDSLKAAEAVTQVVDCAIGMKSPISDEAAQVFAAALYGAVGFGRSVKEAFQQGRAALLLNGTEEEDTPALVCRRGVDPSAVRLLPAPAVEPTVSSPAPAEPAPRLDSESRWSQEIEDMKSRIKEKRQV